MTDIVFGIVLIFLCNVPSVVGILRGPMNWDKANINCTQSGMMVTPIRSTNLPTNIYKAKLTIWTSNYDLNLGCQENTDVCSAVYVEQVLINELHQGLCLHKCNKPKYYPGLKDILPSPLGRVICLSDLAYEKGGNKTKTSMKGAFKYACANSSLVDINDMKSLGDAKAVMVHEIKYWVQSFNIDHNGFVRRCEMYSEIANAAKEYKGSISMGDCNDDHQFSCVSGSNYHTVISLKSLATHRTAETLVPAREPNRQETYSGISFFHATGIISILAILFGLTIIGCLLKRWITNMKNKVIESLRQKYDHQLYEKERVGTEPEPEPEPETPVSPGGSSLYENVTEGITLHEENLTMSYRVSTDIQHPVTVPPNGTASVSMRPMLRLPERLPSRENAVRQKSNQCMKQMHRGRTSSKPSTTSTSCQDNTVASPTGSEKERAFSNGRNVIQSNRKKPKPVPKPDIRTVMLKHKTKQLQQKGTDVINQEFETSSEVLLYLNTGPEAEIENPEDQDYENMWKDTL